MRKLLPRFLLILALVFVLCGHSAATNQSDTAEVNALLARYESEYRARNPGLKPSLTLLLKAYHLSLARQYKRGLIRSAYFLGECFNLNSNPGKAINFYYRSLKIAEAEKDEKAIGKARVGIGLVYYAQKDWRTAVVFFRKALYDTRYGLNEMEIASRHYLNGICETKLGNYQQARAHLDSSLLLNFRMNLQAGVNENYCALGELMQHTGNYDSASVYYNRALNFYNYQNEPIPIVMINKSFAEIYYNKKQYSKALEYALKASALASAIDFKLANIESFEVTYRIFSALHDYRKAYEYLEKHSQMKDSLLNREVSDRLAAQALTYDFEKKEERMLNDQVRQSMAYSNEIDRQHRKRLITTIIAGFSIVLLLVIAFFFRLVSKQKRASEKLLLNILPEQTALELKQVGKAIPKEHKDVSILFCDIKNFTHLAEKLSPEKLVMCLDHYFSSFDRIVKEAGIEKIKTIGDAYMCVGGLRNDKPAYEEAAATVAAAIRMAEVGKQELPEFLMDEDVSISFRIGIHTGSVISGVVGSYKYVYDIWGEAVNIAARMEQCSEAGRINISDSTYHLISNKFVCTFRGKLAAKNIGETNMYFVEGLAQ